jgi:dihydrofolate reductase
VAKLVYTAIASLDGYIEDASGSFDWAAPDEETHRFVNDLERPIGTYLYGRRMYEVMTYWETAAAQPDEPDVVLDYAALWKNADKIVYSTTLESVPTARTRLERRFDADAVRELKAASDRELSVAGPALAAHAFEAGLVDECALFLFPVIVGAGKPALPAGLRMSLELLDERRFGNGVVYLRYGVASA